MNAFFELYGGAMAVLLSLISTTYFAIKWKGYRQPNSRRFIVALLYWGPLFLMSTMVLHMVQNAYRALVSYQEAGVFNFYYYSLQLFGCVVGYQAYLLLMQCRMHAQVRGKFNRKLFWLTMLIVLTTLPTFAFTPIGIIPPAIMLITIICSLFVHRSAAKIKIPVTEVSINERAHAAQTINELATTIN